MADPSSNKMPSIQPAIIARDQRCDNSNAANYLRTERWGIENNLST
jgi:hypothetical protein